MFLFSWQQILWSRIYGFTPNELKESHPAGTENLTNISRKRCKIGSKLLSLTRMASRNLEGLGSGHNTSFTYLPVPSGLLVTVGLNILLNMLCIILEMMYHSSILRISREEKSKQNAALFVINHFFHSPQFYSTQFSNRSLSNKPTRTQILIVLKTKKNSTPRLLQKQTLQTE